MRPNPFINKMRVEAHRFARDLHAMCVSDTLKSPPTCIKSLHSTRSEMEMRSGNDRKFWKLRAFLNEMIGNGNAQFPSGNNGALSRVSNFHSRIVRVSLLSQ